MRDDLLRHVADKFELLRLVAEATGEEFVRTPYTEELVSARNESLFPFFEHSVCRALAARESFRQDAPPWAPDLPLSSADCEKMICGRSSKIALVGYYGRSLACANWGVHPMFRDYACGLMASPDTPEHIRADPALLKEFPPRELPGLDQSLCWNTFGRIFEFTQQLMRNEENWRRCGLAADAAWARSVIERITRVTLDKSLRDFLETRFPPRG
jgi:hypothetical protein